MELHRLTPMKSDYDSELFDKLYRETKSLRKNLVKQIDANRFGVTPDIIESWFDDKFIFTFNKYCDKKDPKLLKGYIINSLKTYKFRVLRKAYTQQAEYFSGLIELDSEEKDLINIIPAEDDNLSNYDLFIDTVINFFKERLSQDAYEILQLQLNPPPYILSRLNKSSSRISTKLIIEYFQLDDTKPVNQRINGLRKEIDQTIEKARECFNSPALTTN